MPSLSPINRPNILLITADQMRWDTMGCAGNKAIATPNLDALSARGIRFTNAFTPNPICVPARASIMTGNYSQTCTGIKSNGGGVREGQPLLTSILKTVGYRCFATGKLHFVPYSLPGQPRNLLDFDGADIHESGRILGKFDPEGKMRGLEDYFDYLSDVGWHGYGRAHGIGNNDVRPSPSPVLAEHYVDAWIADRTIDRIERHIEVNPTAPFFLWMSSPKPHAPYDPPRPYDSLYDPRELPRPKGCVDDLVNRCPALDYTRRTHGIDTLSPEAWQVIRSFYYGNITFLDKMIGRVLDYLDQKKLTDNTLILFTSDHGDLLGDFGSCFKANHLNGSVRIPFLVAGPNVKKGQVSHDLVGLQDILPTLATAANAAVGQNIDGVNLTELLAGHQGISRDSFYATTITECGFSVMLATREWKYIYSEAGGTEELYDCQNDPDELRNLASCESRQPVLATMKERLIVAARELGDHEIFESDKLRSFPVDRQAFAKLKATKMGWRTY